MSDFKSDFKPMTGITWNAGRQSGMVNYGDDSNLLVMFYNRSIPVPSESIKAGRPIHKDMIYVKIQQPGEMLNVVDRPVTDQDKYRFKQQWAAFIHDRTQVPEGTPIEQLFPNHPAVAENLRGFGVFTIEQCAALSANAIDTIGRGAQEYVNRSKRYLDTANKGLEFHKLQKENDDLRQSQRILESQLAQMKSQLDSFATKLVDPVRASLSPPFIPNHDPQTDRINNNAPTREFVETKKRGRRGQVETPTPPITIEDTITDPLASVGLPLD